MNYISLNNGLKMLQLGYGVWQVEDRQATDAVAKHWKLVIAPLTLRWFIKMKLELEKQSANQEFLVRRFLKEK